MSEPYLGEIRLVGFTFAPVGWLLCQGQVLNIGDYEALFTLIGTTYGGDGQTTFMLPNLSSRVAVGQGTLAGGSTYPLGQMGGAETVTLTTNNLPSHTHPLLVSANVATASVPTAGSVLAMEGTGSDQVFTYAPAGGAQQPLSGASIGTAGGSQPHANRQPYLALNYIIATDGIYPSSQA